MNGLEVPDYHPAWAEATFGLGTLLPPLGFQTLQLCQDPAGGWGEAAPHS